jgi:hypothetical protein
MPNEARAKKRHMESVQPYIDAGFTIADFETQLPAEESVVTGWKTLGDGPALSADHWMRKNGHSW